MKQIFTSASKVVFLLLTITSSLGFFFGLLSEANFMLLAGSAFTFYFTNKNETIIRKKDNASELDTETTSDKLEDIINTIKADLN